MTTPIVHITPAGPDLQAQLDHARECVIQMARMNELMVSELAEARVELDRLKAQPVQEPVAWMHDPESYSIVDARQKEMNEFQYSPEFLAGHTIPLYRAPVQPVQPSLTDAEFPELPRPDRNAWPNGFHDLFTAQQMRDYTQQAAAPILAKLATQVALVEKCMVAMNENADRGEKAEAEVGRLVRKLALEREEFKSELDRLKAQPVQPAPLTDVCNHSNIIKADCIAWCGSCGVITWASDAIERVPGADAIARQKWCDENVVAWGCTNEASGRKCCKRWCQQRYCPVSLRADSGTGVQYD